MTRCASINTKNDLLAARVLHLITFFNRGAKGINNPFTSPCVGMRRRRERRRARARLCRDGQLRRRHVRHPTVRSRLVPRGRRLLRYERRCERGKGWRLKCARQEHLRALLLLLKHHHEVLMLLLLSGMLLLEKAVQRQVTADPDVRGHRTRITQNC